jgi:hypothetical protein
MSSVDIAEACASNCFPTRSFDGHKWQGRSILLLQESLFDVPLHFIMSPDDRRGPPLELGI